MLPKGPKIPFEHEATLDWSVVVPVHRKRRGLRRAIKSVLDQLRPGMELIVADHSKGALADFSIMQFAGSVEDLVSVRLVDPAGSMAGDWNRAISLCRGRWIHLLHDDDWVEPRFYESLAIPEPLYLQYGIATTGYRNVELGVAPIVTAQGDEANVPITLTFERAKFELPIWPGLAMTNQFQPSAVVVARKTYEDFGGYLDMPHCPDWEFYARVSEAGVKWYLCNEVLCTHTEGSGECESAAPWIEQITGYRKLLEYFYVHGIQRDALAAGANVMLQAAMKRCIKSASDLAEEEFELTSTYNPIDDAPLKAPEYLGLLTLAVDCERQRRRYLA